MGATLGVIEVIRGEHWDIGGPHGGIMMQLGSSWVHVEGCWGLHSLKSLWISCFVLLYYWFQSVLGFLVSEFLGLLIS